MAVMLVTSLGDIVIDLFVEDAPMACENFLKLCKIKYYNDNMFFNVQKGWVISTGDPTNTGKGGQSIWGVINGPKFKFFPDEVNEKRKHTRKGTVSMANLGKNRNGSAFLITLANKIPTFDGRRTVFGVVEEGYEIVEKIGGTFVDEKNVPLKNIRIRHTQIIDDPFPDPKGLKIPSRSPSPEIDKWDIDYDGSSSEEQFDSDKEVEQVLQKEDKQREIMLEMIGDIPDADLKPPDNVLFVCKLNAVTEDDALELIFSRFGKINSCEVIRDYKTGDSLQYAFIEFDLEDDCKKAYLKMDNVLIDDRRIHVDFSQSVAKFWAHYKRAGKFSGQSARTMGVQDTMLARERKNMSRKKDNSSKSLSFDATGSLKGTMIGSSKQSGPGVRTLSKPVQQKPRSNQPPRRAPPSRYNHKRNSKSSSPEGNPRKFPSNWSRQDREKRSTSSSSPKRRRHRDRRQRSVSSSSEYSRRRRRRDRGNKSRERSRSHKKKKKRQKKKRRRVEEVD